MKYRQGDWIVHCHFGTGRIGGTEVKSISGRERRYYRIRTLDGMFWVPVDKIDNKHIRPLSNQSEFQEAIDALKRPPKEMAASVSERKQRVQRIWSDNTPLATARIVRDLWARRSTKGSLSEWERQALRTLRSRLAQEWAVCNGIEFEEAQLRLEQLLR